SPIRLSWFALVFPCLALNYFGQGALILQDPRTIDNPFFHLAPHWARLPLVALATLATVIASQAVISGAFSVSRQANRLGLLPRQYVRHTSQQEGGQIYIGSINWMLFVGVLLLIAVFRSSFALASAYGLAVTGTLVLTTMLFLYLARHVWRVQTWKIVVAIVLIVIPEVTFLAANLAKTLHGGWLPLLIAALLVTLMAVWREGAARMAAARVDLEGPLDEFIAQVNREGIQRVPGLAVFPHPDRLTTPLALRENVEFNKVLHEQVVIVSIVNENVPHIRHVDRASVHDLGHGHDGIVHVQYRVGFNDSQDVPQALVWARGVRPETEYDPAEARYFLSVLHLTHRRLGLRNWRTRLFLWLVSTSANRTQVFHLPPEQTVVMGGHLNM
ncbi:MAG TPA: KUP/HAK/KT family potassium transporter, partial [Dermatophilaceae bacterium]|nr:KUP/HAK/KT family potassium transporter [Dermatophilaceae bacterium]